MKLIKTIILSIFLLGLFTNASAPNVAQSAGTKIKSAYLINFLRFIEWPSDKSKNINIGFLGDTPIEDFLNKTKAIAESRAKIKINTLHFSSATSVNDVDILFVADFKEFKKNDALQAKTIKENVLVITERSLAMPKMSCINFLIIEGKIRFEIDNNQLKTNGLKASAQLLKLSYKR